MEENTLLLSLIKDHIVYSRLINGLNATGLDTGHFMLDLSDTIFKLAGLYDDLEENRYDYYLTMVERINHFSFNNWQQEIEPLTREIYETIIRWQEEDVRCFLPYVEYE